MPLFPIRNYIASRCKRSIARYVVKILHSR